MIFEKNLSLIMWRVITTHLFDAIRKKEMTNFFSHKMARIYQE